MRTLSLRDGALVRSRRPQAVVFGWAVLIAFGMLSLPSFALAEHCAGEHWTLEACGAGQCREANCASVCDEGALAAAKAEWERYWGVYEELSELGKELWAESMRAYDESVQVFDDFWLGYVGGKLWGRLPPVARIYFTEGRDASIKEAIRTARAFARWITDWPRWVGSPRGAATTAAWIGFVMDGVLMSATQLGLHEVGGRYADASRDAAERAHEALLAAYEAHRRYLELKAQCERPELGSSGPEGEEDEEEVWKPEAQRELERASEIRDAWRRADGLFEDAEGNIYLAEQALERALEIVQRGESGARWSSPGVSGDLLAQAGAGDDRADGAVEMDAMAEELASAFESLALALVALEALAGELERLRLLYSAPGPGVPLAEALASSDAAQRREAAAAIEVLGVMAPGALPALVGALQDVDAAVRLAAARALGSVGGSSDELRLALIAALADADPSVRVAAARALGEARIVGSASVLAERLSDDDPNLREAAVWALVRLARASPAVTAPLLEALTTSDEEMPREALREALSRVASDLGTGVALDVPKGVADPYAWFAVPAGGHPSALAGQADDGDSSLPLAPGDYDLYWVQSYDHRAWPLRVAERVEVSVGGTVEVPLDTGVGLVLASWVPSLDPNYGWWGVVPEGRGPGDRVNWTASDSVLLAPVGRYDVMWVQRYDHRERPMRIAQGVEIAPDAFTMVQADAGMAIEVGSWVPALDASYGWWGAVPEGKSPDERVNWSNTADPLLLPPAVYDVYWVQDYDHLAAPLRVAAGVEVRPAERVLVPADSGIVLELAPWVQELDASYGWWGAVSAGGSPDERVHWTNDSNSLLLPQGAYDVYWVQDYDHAAVPLRLASGVVVEPKARTTVVAAAGIALDVAADTPGLDVSHGWWGVSAAGSGPEARLHWAENHGVPLLLPPGTYDVYWKQDYEASPVVVAEGVAVTGGELVSVAKAAGD